MAKAKAPTTNGTTDAGTAGSATTASTSTRKPRDPNVPTVYWDQPRLTALATLLFQRPGQLTGAQAAQILSGHPAFVDQQQIFASGAKDIGEKVRQQAVKLAKWAEEKGQPQPKLKKLSNSGVDLDAVFAQATAQIGGQVAQGGFVGGTSQGVASAPIPLVPAGGQAVGGLIPVPQG